jgi:hypothetical protein
MNISRLLRKAAGVKLGICHVGPPCEKKTRVIEKNPRISSKMSSVKLLFLEHEFFKEELLVDNSKVVVE